MIDSPKFRKALEIVKDAERTAPRDNMVHYICRILSRKGYPASHYETERKPPEIGAKFNGYVVVWVGKTKHGLPAYNGFRSVILVDRKYF